MKKWWIWLALLNLAWAQPAVVVEAEPTDALIFVDRQIRGQGRVELRDLPAGKHLLRVSAGEDWEPHWQTFQLGGQSLQLQIKLKKGGAKWLRLGRQALAKGDLEEAVYDFQQAAPSRPVAAAWWEGIAHRQAGQLGPAIGSLRTYAQYQPDVPELNWLLGELQERSGNPGAAFTAYKKAALALPELARALDGLGPPREEAIAKLRKAHQSRDLLRLSQLLMLKGRHQEACQAIKKALGGRWDGVDWLRWEPPLPEPPKIETAPPEEMEH